MATFEFPKAKSGRTGPYRRILEPEEVPSAKTGKPRWFFIKISDEISSKFSTKTYENTRVSDLTIWNSSILVGFGKFWSYLRGQNDQNCPTTVRFVHKSEFCSLLPLNLVVVGRILAIFENFPKGKVKGLVPEEADNSFIHLLDPRLQRCEGFDSHTRFSLNNFSLLLWIEVKSSL